MSYYYMNLPFDLSGSRSKNRFRNEILWGLKKILELYKQDIAYEKRCYSLNEDFFHLYHSYSLACV